MPKSALVVCTVETHQGDLVVSLPPQANSGREWQVGGKEEPEMGAPLSITARSAETSVVGYRGSSVASLTCSAGHEGRGEGNTPAPTATVGLAEAAVENSGGMAGRTVAPSVSESTSPTSPGWGAPQGPDPVIASGSACEIETISELVELSLRVRARPGPSSSLGGGERTETAESSA